MAEVEKRHTGHREVGDKNEPLMSTKAYHFEGEGGMSPPFPSWLRQCPVVTAGAINPPKFCVSSGENAVSMKK
jgi:hypothetical protein